MELKEAFGKALRRLRISCKLSQESFSTVSSRTYLSTLERGLKSPTLEKVEDLAVVMDIHPLTLITSAYLEKNELTAREILFRVRKELRQHRPDKERTGG
ncbi:MULTISPECIES: helix-turn-helix domain-containing protein [Pseudomonadaceae]|jgi:transcriptional regulator with XRE-family HTH domain|uniref:helix-turn-helix domain-containing protein n=1 Tax=Pseudomonadaceae TaxID=135621 RepID=UPI001CA3A38E|nr:MULTISPECIES: helix-turn-helix transcriptional regulator [Pseudomonadaceae]UNG19511.1 helix-turn-helix domain-containing protein [Stutzerimonas zhaodongensis]